MSNLIIDNIIERQTPEGVELSLIPAGILPRMGAWIIDLMIRLLVLIGLFLIFQMWGMTGYGIIAISYFLLDWFYAVIFEVFFDGQTIGKKKFGLQVCQDDGTPIRWQASMLRNLLRAADFLPMAFFSGIVSMLFHPASKRLGDMVAGTMVVYVTDIQDNFNIPQREPLPLPMPLALDEQQAILAFAERRDTLPPERRQELAQILQPVASMGGSSTSHGQEMSDSIVGYANTIVGR